MPDRDLISPIKLGRCSGIFRSLFILAGQRLDWSPFLILSELWRLLTNIKVQGKINRLLRQSPFAEILHDNPGLGFKYVAPNYIARSFTISERATCFLYHYKRILGALPVSVLRRILKGEVKFHEISRGGTCFALTLGLPRPPFDKEGELSLSLHVDDKRIFVLSFIIVPGEVVGSGAAELLLITRLQGTPGCRREMRLVRKCLYEFSPKKLLLAALQGVADSLMVKELAAVSATNQKAYEKEHAGILINGYDIFFSDFGMTKTAAAFYSCPIPIEEKPLSSFSGSNKSRARKRRAMRQQIKFACTSFLMGSVERSAHEIPFTATSIRSAEVIESTSFPCSEPNPSPHFES